MDQEDKVLISLKIDSKDVSNEKLEAQKKEIARVFKMDEKEINIRLICDFCDKELYLKETRVVYYCNECKITSDYCSEHKLSYCYKCKKQ